ncbi:hypothetical protein GGS21DRAFT_490065 [Xylaria nigripes]|nr:hypothetical protein GGS21DRAFT_490065 [Xylaria nigripes]
MAEEVEQLLLAPFRDIVEKGRTAVKNAECTDDEAPGLMLNVAQKLMREGERALKNIEPVAMMNYEEYGYQFIDAVKENDDIARFRKELVELLWEFDDYVKVEDFDAGKFDELQKASRKVAPQIWEALKRMKLLAHAPTLISPPPSDSEVPMSPDATSLWRNSDTLGSQTHTTLSDRTNSRHSGPSDPPPTPPSADPWQIKRASVMVYSNEEDSCEQRQLAVPDSPTIPTTQLISLEEKFMRCLQCLENDCNLHNGPELPVKTEKHAPAELLVPENSQARPSDRGSWPSPLKPRRWTDSTQGSTEFVPVPPPRSERRYTHAPEGSRPRLNLGHEAPGHLIPSATFPVAGNLSQNGTGGVDISSAREAGLQQGNIVHPLTTSMAHQKSPAYLLSSQHTPSTESINSSVFDVIDALAPAKNTVPTHQESSRPPKSPKLTSYQRTGYAQPGYPGPPPLHQIPLIPPQRRSGTTKASQSPGAPGSDEGLVPVQAELPASNEAAAATAVSRPEPGCAITPSSSFYRLKGFCKGAEAERNGQAGFKKIRRPVGGFATVTVAKCNHCLYELDYKAVEEDLNHDSSASHTSNTVGYRVRILQKSHLPTRVIDEPLYGCVFCIQTGRTLEESDATVFFSKMQLWAHLARHPRPLPKVTGVTAIEEPELPRNVKDNFDLHFPHPPTESIMLGAAKEVSKLPTALAIQTKRISHKSVRLPPDRGTVLQFAIGAKIVGIEFPVKYDGKWAIGWHDGVRGAFETDTVHLEAPPPTEMKSKCMSNVTATARWKWSQKGDERWLKFDKWDIISNISCVYTDHWCWSGTTAKGWGIFPQSHLDPETIRVLDSRDPGLVASYEKKSPLKFSFRNKKEYRKTSLLTPHGHIV